MIKTGKEHLEQLRDGRVVFIGDEKISDVCNVDIECCAKSDTHHQITTVKNI